MEIPGDLRQVLDIMNHQMAWFASVEFNQAFRFEGVVAVKGGGQVGGKDPKMRTEVMEEGKFYLAADIMVQSFASRRYLRICGTNFSFEFLTSFQGLGECFQVVQIGDVVTVERLAPGYTVPYPPKETP